MRLILIIFAMISAQISFGQKILGLNLKGNPKELTGHDLQYCVGLEKFLLNRMGSELKFLPLNFKEGHLSQETEDYLYLFGLTEIKIQYPLGISRSPSYSQLSFFNQMQPNEIHLHTNLESNIPLTTLYKWFFKLKRQMTIELGAPQFEQSDESQNFLRWTGMDYQIIVSLIKDNGETAIWLSYFPK